ncbi:MAG: hypothetical protein WBX35_09790, partial [Pseudolabrys sp.]
PVAQTGFWPKIGQVKMPITLLKPWFPPNAPSTKSGGEAPVEMLHKMLNSLERFRIFIANR